jgi:hypothetical protein
MRENNNTSTNGIHAETETDTQRPAEIVPQEPRNKPTPQPQGNAGDVPIDVVPEANPAVESVTEPPITRLQLVQSILDGHTESATDDEKKTCNNNVRKYLLQIIAKFDCIKDYNLIILYDNGSLIKGDADRIYNAITQFDTKKPLLLMLYSRGGSPGSGYLIGKLCREYSEGNFKVCVPRAAKSAATLICCAANEIHMGSLSELGPIDPQIDDMPALGLKYSVEHIAELVKRYPSSSDMLAKYLNHSLPLIHLGYYERVAESAIQYAERLLSTHEENLKRRPKEIAEELVHKYKDHSFVIDKTEAEEIFGDEVIKKNTPEYELGNGIYKGLAFIYNIADAIKHNFYFIGSLDSDPVFSKNIQPEN